MNSFLLILLCAVSLSSCSLLFPKSQILRGGEFQTLSQSLRAFCLDSEGKGRIEYPQGRHLFSYESLHQEKEKVWLLEVFFPLREGQVFKIDYSQAHKGRFKVQGGGGINIKSQNRLRFNEESLFASLGKILALRAGSLKPRQWPGLSGKVEEDGRLTLTFPSPQAPQGESVSLEAFGWSSLYGKGGDAGFYKRVRLTVGQRVKLDFFLSYCKAEEAS